MARLARPREFVVLPREDQHLRLDALTLQRGIVARSLFEGAPVVRLGVDDECRRRDAIDHRHRTLRRDRLGIGADVLIPEERSDVARALERHGVQEAAFDDRRGETLLVRDGPRRQVAAIRPAHDAHAVAVQSRVRRQEPVEKIENVGHVDRAHRLPDASPVRTPVAR